MFEAQYLRQAIQDELERYPHYKRAGVSLSDIATDLTPIFKDFCDHAYKSGRRDFAEYLKRLSDNLRE